MSQHPFLLAPITILGLLFSTIVPAEASYDRANDDPIPVEVEQLEDVEQETSSPEDDDGGTDGPTTMSSGAEGVQPEGAETEPDGDIPEPTVPQETSVSIQLPNDVIRIGRSSVIKATLKNGSTPVAGATVNWRIAGVDFGSSKSDSNGVATLKWKPSATGKHAVSAKFSGSDDYEPSSTSTRVTVRKSNTSLSFKVPTQIKDTKTLKIRAQVKGHTVAGRKVTLTVREPSRDRIRKFKARTDASGVARFEFRIYRTARVSAKVSSTETDRSVDKKAPSKIKFLPAGKIVDLPGPTPSLKLKKQPKSVSRGAKIKIRQIPDDVWASMQGKSWRSGCIARKDLRLLTMNYWSFDGYRRQGQIIVASSIAAKTKTAFQGLYDAKVPIRHMYLVDRFGYSSKLGGADDYRSMRADNTSAFNCRGVVGDHGVRSRHSTGRSIDINPWENPYLRWPNTYWRGKSHKSKAAWSSTSHTAVRIFREAGFRWTYGNADGHHFDG